MCLTDELPLHRAGLTKTQGLADRPDGTHRSVLLQKIEMSALTVFLCIWAMVAFCAILFIRGANPRVKRPAKAPERKPAHFSITE
ncbi:hypothetical protein PQQ51_27065 [Paraburkholderia xenovorans]|uniref:hypothetical protein n=1 Tax=Paraburkholderia xenovorans TaxID=36873 RepID=UPI0038BD7F6D